MFIITSQEPLEHQYKKPLTETNGLIKKKGETDDSISEIQCRWVENWYYWAVVTQQAHDVDATLHKCRA